MSDPIAELSSRVWRLEHDFHSAGKSACAVSRPDNSINSKTSNSDLPESQLADLKAGFTRQLGEARHELSGQITQMKNDCLSRLQQLEDRLSALEQRNEPAGLAAPVDELRASLEPDRLTRIEGLMAELRASLDSMKASLERTPDARPVTSHVEVKSSPRPEKKVAPPPETKIPPPPDGISGQPLETKVTPPPESRATPPPSQRQAAPPPAPSNPPPRTHALTVPPGAARPVLVDAGDEIPPGTAIDKEWDGKDENKRNGIVRHLQETKANGANVHATNIITVTALEDLPREPQWAIQNVVDLDSTAFYKSKDKRGQWLKWDFHNRRVKPKAYTICTANCSIYLKSWQIVGSNDDETWVSLDTRTDIGSLRRTGVVETFGIQKPTSKYWRYIRLTLLGQTHPPSPSWTIALQAFEIFGTLIEPAS
jgi:hypothetical protein